jgi:hypothetical protein
VALAGGWPGQDGVPRMTLSSSDRDRLLGSLDAYEAAWNALLDCYRGQFLESGLDLHIRTEFDETSQALRQELRQCLPDFDLRGAFSPEDDLPSDAVRYGDGLGSLHLSLMIRSGSQRPDASQILEASLARWERRERPRLAMLRRQLASLIPKGRPGRIGYPVKAKKFALKLREKNPNLTAKELREACLKKFDADDMPPDDGSFRRWMNRP